MKERSKRSTQEGVKKVKNFMLRFDKIVACECDSPEDGLALASAMLSYSKNLFEIVLGEQKAKTLMTEVVLK